MQDRGNANGNGYSHVPIRPRHTEVTSESQPERKKGGWKIHRRFSKVTRVGIVF